MPTLKSSPVIPENVVVDQAAGTIDFNGAQVAGQDSVVSIMYVEFTVIDGISEGTTGNVDLSFSAMAAANTFEDLLPKLGINNFSYEVSAKPLLGDVNGDGLVNSTDALIVLSFDAGLTISDAATLERLNASVGDVNADGATNSTDALLILSYDVGLFVPAPVNEPTCLN